MVTALVMQLIQSVAVVPSSRDNNEDDSDLLLTDVGPRHRKKGNNSSLDQDVVIITSYESAMRIANMFLLVYLKKYEHILGLLADLCVF